MHSIFFLAGIGKASVEGKIEPVCQAGAKINLKSLDAASLAEIPEVKNTLLKMFLDFCTNSVPNNLGELDADKISNDFILDLYNRSSGGKITVESIRQFIKQPINQDSDTIECSVVINYRKLKDERFK